MQKIKKSLQQKASETQHFNLYQANAAYLFLIMSTFVIKLHKGHLIKHTEDVSEICNLWLGVLTLSHFDVLNIFSKFSATAGEWINTTLFLILLLLNVNFIHMAYNYLQTEFKADKKLKVSFCLSLLKLCVYMCLYMSACVSAVSAAI